MLELQIGEGLGSTRFAWSAGDEIHGLLRNSAPRATMLRADGKELELIVRMFSDTVPFPRVLEFPELPERPVTWRAPWAAFIAENLFDRLAPAAEPPARNSR